MNGVSNWEDTIQVGEWVLIAPKPRKPLLFEVVTNRRRDLLDLPLQWFQWLYFLILLADGVMSAYRHEARGWLLLAVVGLASIAWLVRWQVPERKHRAMQLYVVGTGLAMVAYGAFSIRHAGKFGWLYVVSAAAGLLYSLFRTPKPVRQADC